MTILEIIGAAAIGAITLWLVLQFIVWRRGRLEVEARDQRAAAIKKQVELMKQLEEAAQARTKEKYPNDFEVELSPELRQALMQTMVPPPIRIEHNGTPIKEQKFRICEQCADQLGMGPDIQAAMSQADKQESRCGLCYIMKIVAIDVWFVGDDWPQIQNIEEAETEVMLRQGKSVSKLPDNLEKQLSKIGLTGGEDNGK